MVTAARTWMVTVLAIPTSHRLFATTAQTRDETVWKAPFTHPLVRLEPALAAGLPFAALEFSPDGPEGQRAAGVNLPRSSLTPVLQELGSRWRTSWTALGAQTCFAGRGPQILEEILHADWISRAPPKLCNDAEVAVPNSCRDWRIAGD